MSLLKKHELACDVLVAGGGMAGVCAALAAARCGASVILCQDRPVLGGNASSEVRMHIVGADSSGARGIPLAVEARESGIIEEIRLENCVRNPQRSASMMDLILYEKCRDERNLTLLLNTPVIGAEVENRRIIAALAQRQSTEDDFRIAGKVFIDCTGDGRLGAEAGACFRQGRESKDEFGETLAQDKADNKRLGSTLLFQARRRDQPVSFTAPAWARKFSEENLKFRPHATGHIGCGLSYGYWWLEWGGALDTIKDNETIRDNLLAIMLGVWDHIKNGGNHGADNWALDWFGFLPGKRESRRFTGKYVLTESDLKKSRQFEDAIAYGGWPIDEHPPEGIDSANAQPCRQHELEYLYNIPLRCCVSNDIDNLMFAGRNISASHVAFASTRVMATCAVIGQGTGTAAAYATLENHLPSKLPGNPDVLHCIQQQLLRDDAYLIGLVDDDADNLARCAQVSATSEQSSGRATNVISGQTRAVDGKNGVPQDRANTGTHRWMSDAKAGLPASLELTWDRNIRPTVIHLVFDTGLHRALTLTHDDAYSQQMVWGKPQPETVRDYTIEGCVDGTWQKLADVSGNYQRLRITELDNAPMVQSLRFTVTATNGLDHARICEVRVYEPRR